MIPKDMLQPPLHVIEQAKDSVLRVILFPNCKSRVIRDDAQPHPSEYGVGKDVFGDLTQDDSSPLTLR